METLKITSVNVKAEIFSFSTSEGRICLALARIVEGRTYVTYTIADCVDCEMDEDEFRLSNYAIMHGKIHEWSKDNDSVMWSY